MTDGGNSLWGGIGHTVGSVLGGVFQTTSLGTAPWVLPNGLGATGVLLDRVLHPRHGGGDGGGDKGAAAAAEQEKAASLAALTQRLVDLDKSAHETLDAVARAGKAGQAELDKIKADIEAKVAEMERKSRSGEVTAQDFKDFGEWLDGRLRAAREVLARADEHAEDEAQKTADLTQKYHEVCPCQQNGSGQASTGGAGGGEGGRNAATVPASDPPAQQQPLGAAMPGAGFPGGMPGMGGFPMPGFGGAGMPGVGDPLGALSGLGPSGTPAAHGLGVTDDAASTAGAKSPDDALKVPDAADTGSDDAGGTAAAGAGSTHGQPVGDDAAVDGGDGGDGGSGDEESQEVSAKSTEVQLPSGETTEARSAAGAQAVRAALNGASVSEAYQQAQPPISVPPPGTPVTEPVSPTQLKAGDVGMWKDHMVMALGNGKVLVSGQVQPQDSVGSGPDFLGWFDPTADGAAPRQTV